MPLLSKIVSDNQNIICFAGHEDRVVCEHDQAEFPGAALRDGGPVRQRPHARPQPRLQGQDAQGAHATPKGMI